MIYAYPCQLTSDEDGTLVVTFPDVPEAITGGRDRPEALAMAEDALATALAGYVHEKRDIPPPSEAGVGQASVPVPTVVAAKLALYSAMRAQRITKVELADRLGVSESAVRKADQPGPPLPHESGAEGAAGGGTQPEGRGDRRLNESTLRFSQARAIVREATGALSPAYGSDRRSPLRTVYVVGSWPGLNSTEGWRHGPHQ